MHKIFQLADDERWNELIALVEAQMQNLTQNFINQVREIPEYSTQGISDDDLRNTATKVFAYLSRALLGPHSAPDDEFLAFSDDLGVRRARAGIPPESLIAAVRLDFAVLWETLLDVASPEDAALLASRVQQVWSLVDEFASRTQSSYMHEKARMSQEESSIRQEFITRLFHDIEPSSEMVAQVALALGVDANAKFGLLAATGEDSVQLRSAARQINSLGAITPWFIHEAGGATVVFWPVFSRRSHEQFSLPIPFSNVRCGYVESTEGLRKVAAAARTAVRVAGLLRSADSSPQSAAAMWPRLSNDQLQACGVDIAGKIELDLASCRHGERERIIETVQIYLRTGNVTATAEQMYCHRNTILNRLNKFTELTSLDLTVPVDTAKLVVAWA